MLYAVDEESESGCKLYCGRLRRWTVCPFLGRWEAELQAAVFSGRFRVKTVRSIAEDYVELTVCLCLGRRELNDKSVLPAGELLVCFWM